uniref:Putative secreted protein n=1 Tax=Amblyomma parvum TaxID=251391 RepID=A0A023G2C0_AMBPA
MISTSRMAPNWPKSCRRSGSRNRNGMFETCSRLGWPFLAASTAAMLAAAAAAAAAPAPAAWAPVSTTPGAPPLASGSRSVCAAWESTPSAVVVPLVLGGPCKSKHGSMFICGAAATTTI